MPPEPPRQHPAGRRRALRLLAWPVLVLPLVASNVAPSADAGTNRPARTPKVLIKVAEHRVTTTERARVDVVLRVPGRHTREAAHDRGTGLGRGRVEVAVRAGGARTRTVKARLHAGRATVTLPKLPVGIYSVRATFLGNSVLDRARSRTRTLRVVGAGGSDGGDGSAGCGVARADVVDGPDGRGGCFPGPSNTGPDSPASRMAAYTGPCTITTPDVTIDSKVVDCRTLVVAAGGAGLVLKNSYLNGGIVQSGGAASFSVVDSRIDSGVQYPACSDGSCPAGTYACGDVGNATTDCGVTGSNFTLLRTEILNSNRAAYCETSCLIKDSWFHGTTLWPDASNLAHASSVREEQHLTLRHSSLDCSYSGPFVNDDIGCSADLTGYPDFAPVRDNTVDGNLFVASPGSGFCAYGGSTAGKPFSDDPTNGTHQRFTDNVFQRGADRTCGAYGPVTAFDTARAGNVWSGNVWDDGTPVPPAL